MSLFLRQVSPFSRERHYLMEDAVNGNRLNSSVGALSSRGSGGSSIVVRKPMTSSPPEYTPFQIFVRPHLVSGVWDNTYDINLWPGTVNQSLATNYAEVINQAISSTLFVVLTCASDGYSVTSYTWSLVSTPPTPPTATADTPPTSFSIILGVIFWDATLAIPTFNLKQIVRTNLISAPVEWIQTSRTGAEPFVSPIQYYWAWETSAA